MFVIYFTSLVDLQGRHAARVRILRRKTAKIMEGSNMRKPQAGFTLIEIAIVLVIIGLLLGGVLKGQELITAARVRNLISNQDGVKAAYFGFLDRFRALPGDYSQANPNIAGVLVAANGNNNGRIESI